MKTLTVILLALTLTGAVQAGPPSAPDFLALCSAEQETRAAGVLKERSAPNDVFALGGIGIAGVRPVKFAAYQALLRRKDKVILLTEILRSADSLTQLYALKGLSVCAPDTFRKIAPDYVRRTDTILRGQGCLVTTTTFGQMVRDMEAAPGVQQFR